MQNSTLPVNMLGFWPDNNAENLSRKLNSHILLAREKEVKGNHVAGN